LQDYANLILYPTLKDNKKTILSPTPRESAAIALSLAHKEIADVIRPPQNM
jgi:hypothetical protein